MINYDKIAAEYAQHRRVHPEVLKSLVTKGGLVQDSRVLEVGCGTGNYIISLHALTGCSAWGIDPSEQMLSRARDRSETIQFKLGKAEKIEFPGNFFDLVFSVDVIHHVRDRLVAFQEAYRVLKTNGQLCTVTDSEWIIRHRQPMTAYFPETAEVDVARYPRTPLLRELMERAGFGEVVEETVEFSYSLTDMQSYRDKAFSALYLIPAEAFQCGLARMEHDLAHGPIPCISRYLLLWGRKG